MVVLPARECNGSGNSARLSTSDVEEDEVEILPQDGEEEEVEEVAVGPQDRIQQVCKQS